MTTTSAQMTLTAMLPYFGGKRTIAQRIVEEFGPHRSYWELFAGSLAVLFAKEIVPYESVNDLYGDVVALARTLASDQWAELAERVRRTLFCEGLYLDSKRWLADADANADEADRAYHLLVVSWMGRNGTAGLEDGQNSNFCMRFTHNGGSSGLRWQSVGRSVEPWHHRMANVAVLQRDAVKLASKISDAPGTVIYADPPYLVKSKRYMVDIGHDQHAELAAALCEKKLARVVVSYYDHPRLAELYPGWTVRHIAAKKTLTVPAGEASDAPEVLLINGPSLAATA